MTQGKLKELLTLYSERLEQHGYTDSDWRDEKPTSIDKFFRDCKKQIAEILQSENTEKVCEWKWYDYNGGYNTTCDTIFDFATGDSGYKYCPNCGGKIKEVQPQSPKEG